MKRRQYCIIKKISGFGSRLGLVVEEEGDTNQDQAGSGGSWPIDNFVGKYNDNDIQIVPDVKIDN